MELRSSTAPVDDPFFAPVRRRHPDVDIVVLPATEAAPSADEAEVRGDDPGPDPTDALARVEAATRPLLAALDAPEGARAETTFRFGVEEGVVRATATAVSRPEHGLAVLDQLHHLLLDHGWAVLSPTQGLPRVTGTHPGTHAGLTVTASFAAASQTLLLTVASEPLSVGVVDARALVAQRPTDC